MVKIQNEVFGKWMLLCMARALEIKMWFERTTFFDSLFEARLASHWFLRYHFDVKSPKTLIVAQDISMLSLKSVSYVVFHFREENHHFLLYNSLKRFWKHAPGIISKSSIYPGLYSLSNSHLHSSKSQKRCRNHIYLKYIYICSFHSNIFECFFSEVGYSKAFNFNNFGRKSIAWVHQKSIIYFHGFVQISYANLILWISII